MGSSFYGWWEKADILITRLVAILFAVLIASQALLMNNTAKTFISRTDKYEGKAIAESQLFIKKGEIEIYIENYQTLRPLIFYVNGDSIVAPAARSIKLAVKNNDVIEVSGAGLPDTAILKITSVSNNIVVPEPGKLIYVNDNLEMIDRVRLR
ncbi:MAG TPA: hypothetical protein PLL98_02625 [Bacillota bacterium]|nr:hypothetical protein [Bacillota bacterium]HOR85359.1 hypothetical protein [Bacillota bacterium]HPL54163.1 hypothetical protein [Bacillota bacterium]